MVVVVLIDSTAGSLTTRRFTRASRVGRADGALTSAADDAQDVVRRDRARQGDERQENVTGRCVWRRAPRVRRRSLATAAAAARAAAAAAARRTPLGRTVCHSQSSSSVSM